MGRAFKLAPLKNNTAIARMDTYFINASLTMSLLKYKLRTIHVKESPAQARNAKEINLRGSDINSQRGVKK